jgi:hypothetical protein
VDIYLVAKPLALSSLPSHLAMAALHNILESMHNAHLPNPSMIIPLLSLFDTYSPDSSCISHRPPNPKYPIIFPLPERTSLTYSPIRGVLAWNWHDFVYIDDSKKGGSSPLGAVATHPVLDTRVKILVPSTPPSHTINRAELAGTDIGLQFGRTRLLNIQTTYTRSALSKAS